MTERVQTNSRIAAMFVCAIATCVCAGCGTSRAVTQQVSTKPSAADSTIQHVSLARLQERQGDMVAARRIYDQVLKNNPNQPVARHRLGVIAAKDGKYEKAIEHFEVALKAGLGSTEFFNDLGYAYYLMGDLPLAEKTLRKSVDIDSRNASAHNNLGLVLGAMERDGESMEQFQLAGTTAKAYNNMAWVYAQRGDLEAARKKYLMALDANDQLKNAAEALLAMGDHKEKMQRIARREANLPDTAIPASPKPPQLVSAPGAIVLAGHKDRSEAVVEVTAAEFASPKQARKVSPAIHTAKEGTNAKPKIEPMSFEAAPVKKPEQATAAKDDFVLELAPEDKPTVTPGWKPTWTRKDAQPIRVQPRPVSSASHTNKTKTQQLRKTTAPKIKRDVAKKPELPRNGTFSPLKRPSTSIRAEEVKMANWPTFRPVNEKK